MPRQTGGKEITMKALFLAFVCLSTLTAFAARRPDFSGTWEFNTVKSKNIGMMAQAKLTATLQQTEDALEADTHSSFGGNERDLKTHYDLTGKAASNESPMAGPSQTVSKWDGTKLVTTWTSDNAVAGAKTVRTETRSLSADGNTMTVESVRGDNPPVVMVFDKKR